MNNTDTLKILVNELFEKDEQPTPYEVYTWLRNNQHKIAQAYDKDCHKSDIIFELGEREYVVDKIPQTLIDDIVNYFLEKLDDLGSEYGWRDIMENAIDEFQDDLEPYRFLDDEE